MSISGKYSKVPDLFVIGAQKAGTTSLHNWLAKHQEVALPYMKETHFFSHDSRFSKGIDWYVGNFPNKVNAKVYVEVDPEYLYSPIFTSNLKKFTSCPKFIVVVRDPLARAYSHYRMSVRRGVEPLSFVEALEAEKGRLDTGELFHVENHSYLFRGCYSEHITRIKQDLPDSTFLVLDFENIIDEIESVTECAKICNFLGLTNYNTSLHKTISNVARGVRFSALNKFIWDKNSFPLIRGVLRKVVPSKDMRFKLAALVYKSNIKKVDSFNFSRLDIPNRFRSISTKEGGWLNANFGLNLSWGKS